MVCLKMERRTDEEIQDELDEITANRICELEGRSIKPHRFWIKRGDVLSMDEKYVRISRESFNDLINVLDNIIDELPHMPHFRRKELHNLVENFSNEVTRDIVSFCLR